jgi:hypothetical protein
VSKIRQIFIIAIVWYAIYCFVFAEPNLFNLPEVVRFCYLACVLITYSFYKIKYRNIEYDALLEEANIEINKARTRIAELKKAIENLQ